MGEIIREVGYSDSVAKQPGELIKSKGFQHLMEKHGITDDLLSIKLKEGLEADRPYGKDGDVHPDYATRHRYLDSALKLKGIQETPGTAPGKVINAQINQTNLDPNSKEAKQLIDNTINILMDETLAQ